MSLVYNSCGILLVTAVILIGESRSVDVSSRTVESVAGDTVELGCNLDYGIHDLKWDFTPVGNGETWSVLVGSTPSSRYEDRVSLSRNGKYNLVIEDLRREDAGQYLCRDQYHERDQIKIDLIILDTPPVCRSTAHDPVVSENSCGIIPDDIKLSCSVRYFGNIPPVLKWKTIGNDSSSSSNDNIVSTTVVTKPKWNKNIYTCEASLESQQHCHVNLQRIIYVFNTTSRLTAQWPQSVRCSANTSQACQYEWFLGDKIISKDVTLELTTESPRGEYRCLAECEIRGIPCSVQPLQVDYQYESNCESCRDKIILSSLLAAALSIPVIFISLSVSIQFCNPTETLLKFVKSVKGKRRGKQHPDQSQQKDDNEEEVPFLGTSITAEIDFQNVTPVLFAEINGNGAIKGITILDEKIYIVRFAMQHIEVYTKQNNSKHTFISDSKSDYCACCKRSPAGIADGKFTKSEIRIPGLEQAGDLASCERKQCLYVCDRENNSIHKVLLGVVIANKWSTDTTPEGISVTNGFNVLVVCPTENKVKKYTPDGEMLSVISLPEDIVSPLQAILINASRCLVCYGNTSDIETKQNGLCQVDTHSIQAVNHSKENLWPLRLQKTRNGCILVVAYHSRQIQLFNQNLNLVKVLVILNEMPSRIYLDEGNRRLYVTENTGKHRILIYDL